MPANPRSPAVLLLILLLLSVSPSPGALRAEGLPPKWDLTPQLRKLPPEVGIPRRQREAFRALKNGPLLSVADVRFDADSIHRTERHCVTHYRGSLFDCRFEVIVAVRNGGSKEAGRFAVVFDPLRSGFRAERARQWINGLRPGERAEVRFPLKVTTNRPGRRCVSARIEQARDAAVIGTGRRACIEVPDLRNRYIRVTVDEVVVRSDGDNISDGDWHMRVLLAQARRGGRVLGEAAWERVREVGTGDRFDPGLSFSVDAIPARASLQLRAIIVDCDGGPGASVNRLVGVDCDGEEELLEQTGDPDIATGSLAIAAAALDRPRTYSLRVRESGASDPLEAILRVRITPQAGWPDRF